MKPTLVCLALTGFLAAPASAQIEPADLGFLRPHGLENFAPQTIDALVAFLRAEERLEAEDPAGAERILDALWAQYPTGGANWGQLPTQPFGINVGSPPCYSALRMLSDTVSWRLRDRRERTLDPAAGAAMRTAPRSVRLTVLVVGQSRGVQPRNREELLRGGGLTVFHSLDERIPPDDYRVVLESLEHFRQYVLAMTEGRLGVAVHIVPLPSVSLPVHAVVQSGRNYAGLVDPAQVWEHVPERVREKTDWWWILYPSHVPEQYPDFQRTEFITGGMGVGPDGGSPYFIIDDRWLVRKPPHLGQGPYSDVERRTYLPQWLQHEFFHHLFRTYPEFGLEQTSHQWFDRGSWPPDFVGTYEADYFHEAMVKRLQSADPPLHVGLRYATSRAPWDELSLNDVIGTYRREPVENPWHVGTILTGAGGELRWTNTAGVSWSLSPDLPRGVLWTGPDCPYYDPPSGTKFDVALARDERGDLTAEVVGFRFNGELYRLQ